jgi:hypothetical protein
MQVLQVLQDCDEVQAGDGGDGDNNRIKKASPKCCVLGARRVTALMPLLAQVVSPITVQI